MTYKDFWVLFVDDLRRHPALAILGTLLVALGIINFLWW